MIVYVEYVLLDNLVIDFLILYAVSKLLKLSISKIRFMFALPLAVAFAFITPFLALNTVLLFLVKLTMGIIIVAVAFKTNLLKQFILSYLCFIFMTFLMGGICYGLQGFISGMQILGTSINYSSDYPISLIFIGAFIFFIGGKNLYFALRQRKNNAHITICLGNQSVHLMALVDSGNQLVDDENHLPITFVSRPVFQKLSTTKICEMNGYKQMICSTVGSSYNVIETLLVNKLIIDTNRTFLNARIAVIDLNTKQGCDAIISEKMFE